MLRKGIADKKKMQKVIAVLYIPVISMSRTCVYLLLFFFFVVVVPVTVGLAVIFCWKLILSTAMFVR